jgi:L-threonylcarbamoyladenylate synthase
MSELDHIVRVLKGGGTILYPTDTIWGIGCDATNSKAVEKIFQVKNQAENEPLAVMVDGLDMLHRYVSEVHPRLETLIYYHQRPLTVIYENCKNLADNVMDKKRSAAIRVTLDPFCRELIELLGKPLVATGATYSQEIYPRSFAEIDTRIIGQVDYVVRYKQDQRSVEYPSVIVRLSDRAELDFIRD